MAITQRQIGASIGGASVGLVGAEAIKHAEEGGAISRDQGRAIVAAVGGAGVAIPVLTMAGTLPLSAGAAALSAGVGAGTLGWYAGREVGVAPRLAVTIPDEINVIDPLITASVIGAVGIAAATVTNGFI